SRLARGRSPRAGGPGPRAIGKAPYRRADAPAHVRRARRGRAHGHDGHPHEARGRPFGGAAQAALVFTARRAVSHRVPPHLAPAKRFPPRSAVAPRTDRSHRLLAVAAPPRTDGAATPTARTPMGRTPAPRCQRSLGPISFVVMVTTCGIGSVSGFRQMRASPKRRGVL